jgi:hypothetical protein
MAESSKTLRDRMLRDAIVDVLRGITHTGHGATSLPDVELVADVTVEGDRVEVELVATRERRHWAAGIIADVRGRLMELPELTQADVAVWWSDPEGRRHHNVGRIL